MADSETTMIARRDKVLLPHNNYQRVALINCLPLRDLDCFNRSSNGGSEIVLHLHGFEDGDGLAALNFCAYLEWDAQHKSWHGGAHGGLARLMGRFDGAGESFFALIFDMYLEALPRYQNLVPGAAGVGFVYLSRIRLV